MWLRVTCWLPRRGRLGNPKGPERAPEVLAKFLRQNALSCAHIESVWVLVLVRRAGGLISLVSKNLAGGDTGLWAYTTCIISGTARTDGSVSAQTVTKTFVRPIPET